MPRGPLFLLLAALLWGSPANSATAETDEAKRFYLRVAVGYDWSRGTRLQDRDCNPATRLAFFGCRSGLDGRAIGAYGDFGGSPAGEIAIGARVLPALRLELALSHRPGFRFEGNANFLASGNRQPVEGDVTQSAAMLQAYVDLAPLLKVDLGPLEPFVGAGLGLSRNRVSRVRYDFPALAQPAWTETRGGTHWSLAWSAMLGTALRIGPSSLLEFSYRYSDFGRVQTRDGPITVMRGGNRFTVGNVAGTRGRLRSHGLYLGFRQEF